MKALSPQQRRAVELTRAGFKQRDAATRMGLTEGRISQLLTAARKHLGGIK